MKNNSNELSSKTEADNEIDLLYLIGILYKNKILILVVTIVAMVGVLLYSIISLKLPPEKSYLPNVYKPVSTVRINSESSSSGLSSLVDSSGVGALAGLMGIDNSGSTSVSAFAIKLANSNTIVDQIAKDFKLEVVYGTENSNFPLTSIRNAIKGRLSITEDSSTGTLTISYEDIDKDLATKIVNRIVDILEKRFLELDQNSNYSQKILLEEKIADVGQDISDLQQKILYFQNDNDVLDPTNIIETVGSQIASIRIELVEKEAAIETHRTKTRIQDPTLIRLLDEKAALENSLKALEEGSIQGIPSISDLPFIVMEFEELTRSLEVQSSIYMTLIQQYELLKLKDSGTGPLFQIIEYAEIPEMKSGPSRSKLCVLVTLVAFFISIFFAYLKEVWLYIKKDPESIRKLKGQV